MHILNAFFFLKKKSPNQNKNYIFNFLFSNYQKKNYFSVIALTVNSCFSKIFYPIHHNHI